MRAKASGVTRFDGGYGSGRKVQVRVLSSLCRPAASTRPRMPLSFRDPPHTWTHISMPVCVSRKGSVTECVAIAMINFQPRFPTLPTHSLHRPPLNSLPTQFQSRQDLPANTYCQPAVLSTSKPIGERTAVNHHTSRVHLGSFRTRCP